ncbi:MULTISPECIES: KEOPS complex subunit Pcc1 [unclassified Halorhabdus]|uniref:KEOPS complex subunit Pcc1 n=1 Tax=unclassified Halorhabdus TaxID=2621901 RepID=UPI0023DA840A|nr:MULTISPECIES: KEOPS complex subunit Pcc1 [unclassified Halorhabdus]WEL17045.1 KEOPS complex Pcc1-like subunit [Halorhabdus sp. SVX81]WEL20930.1 KEOPS complex Pcc1-like subunit [Halorhabdus sp. BNX81]
MRERRATIRTTHEDEETASRIAAALAPDNTAEMTTTVEAATVETTIDRETTPGLAATVDDYVVNLSVAVQLSNEKTHPTHE